MAKVVIKHDKLMAFTRFFVNIPSFISMNTHNPAITTVIQNFIIRQIIRLDTFLKKYPKK